MLWGTQLEIHLIALFLAWGEEVGGGDCAGECYATVITEEEASVEKVLS